MYHVLHHSNCLGSCSEQRSSLMELHPAHNTSGYKRSVYNSLVLWPSRCPPCWSHFYKERSVELSGCFSGQPPNGIDGHLWSRDRHTRIPRARVFWPPLGGGAPLAVAPPPPTDMEKGPIQSDSMPGSQTQMPSGAEYHYWLYVAQMVSGAGRWTLQWVRWVWGIRTAMVTAAVWLWGSGSPRVVFSDWWAKRVPVTEGELNHARSFFVTLCPWPTGARSSVFTGQRCVCANSDTLNHLWRFIRLQYRPGQSVTKGSSPPHPAPPQVQRE